MQPIIDHISEKFGVYVHSIRIGANENDDRKFGFLDSLSRQIDEVCEELQSIKELSGGFNAIGFSQGGLFMRAYVQKCNKPPVRNLITFGSPHGGTSLTVIPELKGVSSYPRCPDLKDISCRLAHMLIERGIYLDWVQEHVVQAQYFKDPTQLEKYYEKNLFLTDLNQEQEKFNSEYKKNILGLNNFVLVAFEYESVLIPKQTSIKWFGYMDQNNTLIQLEDQDLYKKDLLGLRHLNENQRLHFRVIEGDHMQINLEEIDEYIEEFFGYTKQSTKKLIVQNN